MTMVNDADADADAGVDGGFGAAARGWWLFLIAGILWVLVSLVILSFDPTSAATIGYLVAFVLIAAGVTEVVEIASAPGWKWAHALLAAVFILAGFAALASPFQTFGILALFIGWYLIFKGIFDICFAIAGSRELHLWGLLLTSGILQLLIGVWALGYPGRSAWLLVLWVGIGALMRGLGEIVLAFHLRHAAHAARTVAHA